MSVRQRLTGFPSPSEAAGTRLKMTYEQYLAWAEGEVFAEWKDGEVIVFMPVKDRHQRIIGLLHMVIGFFIRRRGLGVVRLAPFEVRLGPDGPSREPDLFFVSSEHRDRLTEDRFLGGPDLIIEVVSEDSVTRDYHDKRAEYQAAGVIEYWIIDPRPRHRRAEFYRLDPTGHYQLVGPDAEGVIRSTVLKDFWWRMSWLWDDPEPDPDQLLETISGGISAR